MIPSKIHYTEWKIGDRATVRAIAGGGQIFVDGFNGQFDADVAFGLAAALSEATSIAKGSASSTTSPMANVADLGKMVQQHNSKSTGAAATPAELEAAAKLNQAVAQHGDAAGI
jgi:hypothetical protein